MNNPFHTRRGWHYRPSEGTRHNVRLDEVPHQSHDECNTLMCQAYVSNILPDKAFNYPCIFLWMVLERLRMLCSGDYPQLFLHLPVTSDGPFLCIIQLENHTEGYESVFVAMYEQHGTCALCHLSEW